MGVWVAGAGDPVVNGWYRRTEEAPPESDEEATMYVKDDGYYIEVALITTSSAKFAGFWWIVAPDDVTHYISKIPAGQGTCTCTNRPPAQGWRARSGARSRRGPAPALTLRVVD